MSCDVAVGDGARVGKPDVSGGADAAAFASLALTVNEAFGEKDTAGCCRIVAQAFS
jgi:glycine cleavage system pyridoxal-binding protein P